MSDLFRQRLLSYRKRRNWSQEKLAEQAEMDHSLVSRIEHGQRRPTLEAIGKLVKGLQLTQMDADGLYLAAGFIPPEVPVGTLMAALSLAQEMSDGEINAARALIEAVRAQQQEVRAA
jgi:transcriptional regulator with XRE-family HTH domain